MVTVVINQIFEPKKCFPVLPLQNRTNEEVKKKTKIHLFYFIFTLLIASIWQQWLCHMIKHPRVPLNWILSVFLELLPSRSRVNFELFFRSGMVGVMVGGLVVTENVYIWNSRTIWGKFSVQMQLTCHIKRDALISTENIHCRLALMTRRLTVQLHIHHDDPTRRVLLLGTCTWVTREKMKKYSKKEKKNAQVTNYHLYNSDSAFCRGFNSSLYLSQVI